MVVMSSTLFSASAVSDVCRGMEMADKYDCSSIEVASGLPEWIHSARRLPDFWLTNFLTVLVVIVCVWRAKIMANDAVVVSAVHCDDVMRTKRQKLVF